MALPTVQDGLADQSDGRDSHPEPPDAAVPANLLRSTRRRLRTAGDTARRGDRGRARLTRWRRLLVGAGGLRILTAAAGGYLLNLAFAPHTWWWAAMLGLALFGLAVHGRNLWPAAGLGLIFGLTFYLPLLSWTTVYVGGIALALGIAEAILTAPVGALIASASRRLPYWPAWAAAVWIAGEALRARFPFGGFPWGGIAFSQPDGPLLPVASLLGAPGLAFLTALAGFSLGGLVRTAWIHRKALRPIAFVASAVGIGLPFALGGIGHTTEQTGAGAPVETVAVVQGDVPEPGLEFNARREAVLNLHVAETEQLAADIKAGRAPQPQIVIWPENSSDIDPYTNPDAAAKISAAVQAIGVPTLVGAVVQAPNSAGEYNMGIVWDPQTGPGQQYIKKHPVPFAEYMPWRSFFRIFSPIVDKAGYFLPGDKTGNLQMAGVNVGDVICFEVVYDDLVRDVVDGGAQVLVVQTNNATFGYTDETFQQQAMSRVRAVENGRAVLISATSGVSAVIGPTGDVRGSVGLFEPGYLDMRVPLIAGVTPGTRLGAAVEWTVTGLALGGLAGGWCLDRRRSRREQTKLVGPNSIEEEFDS